MSPAPSCAPRSHCATANELGDAIEPMADDVKTNEVSDWREVICVGEPELSKGARFRRPLSFFQALVIALAIEAGVAYAVMLWMQWQPPRHPVPTRQTLSAHLVLAPPVAAMEKVQGAKGGVNPRIGRDGGQHVAAPRKGAISSHHLAHSSSPSASGQNSMADMAAKQAGQPKKKVAADVKLAGNCAQGDCVLASALDRYKQNIHSLLQSRLDANPSVNAPPGLSVTLSFYARPQGGTPAHVALIEAPVAAGSAVRKIQQVVENTLLPPFPRNLGKHVLEFQVTLHR